MNTIKLQVSQIVLSLSATKIKILQEIRFNMPRKYYENPNNLNSVLTNNFEMYLERCLPLLVCDWIIGDAPIRPLVTSSNTTNL